MASLFDGYGSALRSNPVTIVFGDSLTGSGKEFALDVVTAIKTNMSASITKFPIEEGGNISDHVQRQPLSISLTGLISESPSARLLTVASSLAGFAASSSGQFQGLSSTFAAGAAAAIIHLRFHCRRVDRRVRSADRRAGPIARLDGSVAGWGIDRPQHVQRSAQLRIVGLSRRPRRALSHLSGWAAARHLLPYPSRPSRGRPRSRTPRTRASTSARCRRSSSPCTSTLLSPSWGWRRPTH